MGSILVSLGEVLAGLADALQTVDIRVATCRESTSVSAGEWLPLRTVIRVSFHSQETIRGQYLELERRLGRPRTDRFAIFHAVVPLSQLPALPPKHVLVPRVAPEGLSLETAPLNVGDLKGRVERHRHTCEPIGKEVWPGIEFSFTPNGGIFPAKTTDMAALDAEVRRELGLPSCETAMRAYLEVRDTSARFGNVFTEVLMPASITELGFDGTVLAVETTAAKSLGGLRCFLTKRAPDGLAVLEHREVFLRAAGERGDFAVQRGSTELEADREELIEIVLTHATIPELDEVRRRVHDLLPLAERNPLLLCLSRFWDLIEVRRRLERPYETPRRKLDRSPQMAFQASVAHLLTLAGFQTIDLERDDQMRHPETSVHIATADLLAYHAPRRVLVVGACTINVPRGEDYEKLLHATSVLRREFSEGTRVILVPALFAGQEGDSAVREGALARRVRLLTLDELTKAWRLVEAGEEERLLSFFLGLPSL